LPRSDTNSSRPPLLDLDLDLDLTLDLTLDLDLDPLYPADTTALAQFWGRADAFYSSITTG
jgi:hypothetical protein